MHERFEPQQEEQGAHVSHCFFWIKYVVIFVDQGAAYSEHDADTSSPKHEVVTREVPLHQDVIDRRQEQHERSKASAYKRSEASDLSRKRGRDQRDKRRQEGEMIRKVSQRAMMFAMKAGPE